MRLLMFLSSCWLIVLVQPTQTADLMNTQNCKWLVLFSLILPLAFWAKGDMSISSSAHREVCSTLWSYSNPFRFRLRYDYTAPTCCCLSSMGSVTLFLIFQTLITMRTRLEAGIGLPEAANTFGQYFLGSYRATCLCDHCWNRWVLWRLHLFLSLADLC